jgi:tetratricopeptide (TPR) repeat protein
MTPSPNTRGIARIVRADPGGAEETHIGMAFVVDSRHVMTCCHVVNDALGRRDRLDPAQPPSESRFVIRFPYAVAEAVGKVGKWGFALPQPIDVAVLELEETAPPTAGTAVFSDAVVRGEKWSCSGWDKKGKQRTTQGKIADLLAQNKLQLNGPKGVAMKIVGGYSGAHVWAEGRKAFVGMVVSTDEEHHENGIAYAIPTSVLGKIWPDLLRGSPAPDSIKVMVSSTSRDLPEHRKQIIEACQRVGMVPLLMEHPPADPDVSVQMVDKAGVYIGIFAYRYGNAPTGSDISVAEMEYNRAVERKLPCLIFFMHEGHGITPRDVETGPGAEKLARLKDRIWKSHGPLFFKSPEDLRERLIDSLEELRRRQQAENGGRPEPESFHPPSVIPRPPEPYIAHHYTLLQTDKFVGRQRELTALTDWITGQGDLDRIALLAVVAMGGMGKSALTWHWFETVAEQKWPATRGKLMGRIWWSFYESDAHLENFVPRALAYVLGSTEEDVRRKWPPLHDQEDLLVRELDRRPFLIVLDGLERILAAYTGANAAHLRDEETLDDETLNRIGEQLGLPAGAGPAVVGRHPLRRTADRWAGDFLKRLAGVTASRILLSSRLFPSDLQRIDGSPWKGSNALYLTGLSETDALDLWRAFGAKGSREKLLPVFDTFGRHPLLIQVLAGVVAEFRHAPGDFDAWRDAQLEFNVSGLPLVQLRSHVLDQALRGLTGPQRKVLHTVAGFRMPVGFATLRELFVGPERLRREEDGNEMQSWEPLFQSVRGLDVTLTVLEDRGLLGWERRANRYDLHPIVRGVVWEELDKKGRFRVHQALCAYFQSLPPVQAAHVQGLEDVVPAIELYQALIGLGRYDDAWQVFRERLNTALHSLLSASQQQIGLLELLFPDGHGASPRLQSEEQKGWAIHALAEAYFYKGLPGMASELFRRVLTSPACASRLVNAAWHDLSGSLFHSGQLHEAERAARHSLRLSHELADLFWEAVSLGYLFHPLRARNDEDHMRQAGTRSLRLFTKLRRTRCAGVAKALLADLALRQKDFTRAADLAAEAWGAAHLKRRERDFIRAARVQGAAAFGQGHLDTAAERLQCALKRARAVEFVEEELPSLIALATLHHEKGRTDEARELLNEVWEPAEAGPYPLFHADALNLLARIEHGTGCRDAATDAAARAYRKSWCDGPPYAYHWGLQDAKQLLAEVGASEPDLPAFDPSKYSPMPLVEIDPADDPATGSDRSAE